MTLSDLTSAKPTAKPQKRPLRSVLVACWLLIASALQVTPAMAQEFPPRRGVTLLVGFAAGGAADTAARIIARRLADNLGQTVSVDNRPGAGGNIAHQMAAAGPVDGSLILLGTIGPLAIAPHLMKTGYDAVNDFAPLTMAVNFPNVLVVHSAAGIRNFAEFIDTARRHPGKIDFASTGPASASHLAGELLNAMAGIETVHVPYKGGAPALVDILGARVTSWYATVSTAQQHIESGKLIALASTGLKRHPSLPSVPTIAESGFPGFNATNWYAFVASSKVPKDLLDRWHAELVRVLDNPEVAEALGRHGFWPAPTSRAELGEFIAREYQTWGKVIRERQITGR